MCDRDVISVLQTVLLFYVKYVHVFMCVIVVVRLYKKCIVDLIMVLFDDCISVTKALALLVSL